VIHLSRRAFLIGATAGMVAAGFSGVIAYLGWRRMIHAFAAPLGRLSYAPGGEGGHVMEDPLRPRTGGR
jgi:hypothetical protein